MTKDQIISVVEKNRADFLKNTESEPYQFRGILTSEALLMCALANEFGVGLFIESGRARGYSTKLFARFFEGNKDFKIVSIDFDKISQDTEFSEKELSPYKNVSLLYGDAHEILPEQIIEDCVVFIDGPKGDHALFLAEKVLQNKKVKAVFIHDLPKNTFHRDICEMIFKDTFFSDDMEYVNRFQELDEHCWKKLEGTEWQPHLRKGERIESYSSALGVIFNGDNPVNKQAFMNYKKYYKQYTLHTIKTCAREILSKYPKIYGPIKSLYLYGKSLYKR